jgi:hypothetical protein
LGLVRIAELFIAAIGVATLAVAGSPALAGADPEETSAPRQDGQAFPNPWAVHEYLIWHQAVTAAQYVEAMLKAEQAAEEARLWARWGPVHDCEQPGNWYAAGRTPHGYFEGGLGIERSLYRKIRGHSALLDSPIDQMRVAEIALAWYGPSAWACHVPM